MPYAQVDQFAVDKALNTIVEEGIAPVYIRAYHALQGLKVQRVDKNLGDIKQSKLYDLIDGMGIRWEVKSDRIWGTTGCIYIELQALEASQADKYLILAGRGFVIAKSELIRAAWIHLESVKRGGDNSRSLGVRLPLEIVEEISEQVIVL